MILRSFQRMVLCDSSLKTKSTTFVRNITTIRLRSQFVILNHQLEILQHQQDTDKHLQESDKRIKEVFRRLDEGNAKPKQRYSKGIFRAKCS